MIGPEKHVAKVSRISSLMQQDSAYPKPPTPFPDQEKAERGKVFSYFLSILLTINGRCGRGVLS